MSDKNTTSAEAGKERKTFVIDTNVLIHRPDAILSFRDSDIVLPLWVLEELDKLKSSSDERGRSARKAIRFLDEQGRHGNLSAGVKLENGSMLRVELTHARHVEADLLADKNDNKIILTAYALQKAGKQVFFVSKDINARVKATALGIRAVDYEKQTVNMEKLYSGYFEAVISAEQAEEFRLNRFLPWTEERYANEYLIARVKGQEAGLIGRYRSIDKGFELLEMKKMMVCGIKPLNDKQRIALDLLLDDEVPLVSLVGIAGTGKTLLAIAAGLKRVVEDGRYSRVLVSRPIMPMGKDIGFMPGTKDDKLSHWMQPLFDNLEVIMNVYKKQSFKTVEQLMATKLIELEALTYIRGRSLPKQYLIVDEAQNLTPHEVKTIVSRAGKNTKVVLTGDPYQIDSPYLDANSNGLSYLVDVMKNQDLAGHLALDKSERSPLAELAAKLL